MTDETHFVDGLSLLVPSLKQHALMKVVETLIRPDLEEYRSINLLFRREPFERFSNKIKQLAVPDCLKHDIRDVVLCLYRKSIHLARASSLSPSALKFNVCGDLDVHRTFDAYMDNILRGPRLPRTYLCQFLKDACHFHQDRCIHLTLCELLKWTRSNLEPSLRHARREVNVRRNDDSHLVFWYYDIRFVIEDVDDPAEWISFANVLNIDSFMTEFSFEENVFSVCVTALLGNTLSHLWPKMTTLQKLEHAEEIATMQLHPLQRLDACFLLQVMRYVGSSRRMNLIKRNLASFILSFLIHPYYRRFLPDLQLVEEDLQLIQQENELCVIEILVSSLRSVADYTNISDTLVQLWRYVSSRNDSLGDHVSRNIRTFLYDKKYQWALQDDAKEFLFKLRAVFPAKR